MGEGEEVVVEAESKGRDDEVSGDAEVLDHRPDKLERQRLVQAQVPGAARRAREDERVEGVMRVHATGDGGRGARQRVRWRAQARGREGERGRGGEASSEARRGLGRAKGEGGGNLGNLGNLQWNEPSTMPVSHRAPGRGLGLAGIGETCCFACIH